jgi:hypothetical protein
MRWGTPMDKTVSGPALQADDPVRSKWSVSRRFLIVVIALTGLAITFVLVVIPILFAAPATNHFKHFRPISAAIELELGAERTVTLIQAERLDFCSYVPVRMCVILIVDVRQLKAGELEKILAVAQTACSRLRAAPNESLAPLGKSRTLKPMRVKDALVAPPLCSRDGTEAYQEFQLTMRPATDDYLELVLRDSKQEK